MIKKKLILSVFFSSIMIFSYLSTINVSASITTKRLSGQDRYETCVEISKSGWTQSQWAIIASGENFPDAICAGPLAKSKNAPIILTRNTSLDNNCINELKRLGVNQAYIIGGTGVVSKNVENQLRNLGISFTRFGGKDRYETSVKVAQNLSISNELIVSNGKSYADVLSIAPIAAKKGIPILLTNTNILPISVSNYIAGKSISKSYVIGGTGVVSEVVKSKLPGSKERLGGTDRYDTNIKVLQKFEDELNFTSTYVATGKDFPDALSASALASKNSSPVILTSTDLPQVTSNYIQYKNITNLNIVGGTGVINDTLVSEINEVMEEDFQVIGIW